jgi:uncharacterized protein DUF4242
MSHYMVERYLPGISEQELRQVCARARDVALAMSAEGAAVRHLATAFLAAEESVFCLFEAQSIDAVSEANRRAGFPFARITETLLVTEENLASETREAQ